MTRFARCLRKRIDIRKMKPTVRIFCPLLRRPARTPWYQLHKYISDLVALPAWSGQGLLSEYPPKAILRLLQLTPRHGPPVYSVTHNHIPSIFPPPDICLEAHHHSTYSHRHQNIPSSLARKFFHSLTSPEQLLTIFSLLYSFGYSMPCASFYLHSEPSQAQHPIAFSSH